MRSLRPQSIKTEQSHSKKLSIQKQKHREKEIHSKNQNPLSSTKTQPYFLYMIDKNVQITGNGMINDNNSLLEQSHYVEWFVMNEWL